MRLIKNTGQASDSVILDKSTVMINIVMGYEFHLLGSWVTEPRRILGHISLLRGLLYCLHNFHYPSFTGKEIAAVVFHPLVGGGVTQPGISKRPIYMPQIYTPQFRYSLASLPFPGRLILGDY